MKHRFGEFEATILIERDTAYTRWQRLLLWLGIYLPAKIENWISSFLPEDTYKIEVVVSGNVTPVVRGKHHGSPELCFPDEGGDVDVTGSWANGQPIELSNDEIEKAIESLWQVANDVWASAAEDVAAERYESRLWTN